MRTGECRSWLAHGEIEDIDAPISHVPCKGMQGRSSKVLEVPYLLFRHATTHKVAVHTNMVRGGRFCTTKGGSAYKKSKWFCFKIELHGKPVEPGTRCGIEGLQSLILTHLELRRPSSLHTERALSPHFQVRHAPHACPAKRKRLTHIVRSLHLDPPSHASTYFPSTSKPY